MKLIRRLQYWFRHRQMEADLAEEMKFHETMAGRRAMGNPTLSREDARAVWIWPWLESVWQDVAYGLRSLRRQPGFTAVAILALGCGIGLNTSLFTVFNAAALRPWPVRDPGRVVRVFSVRRDLDKKFDITGGFSYVEYRYLADHTKSMAGLFMTRGEGRLHTDVGKVSAMYVTANYFHVLGVEMERGRGFLAEEDRVVAPEAVAVVAYATWQNRFGGDPGIVGRRFRLEDIPFTIVGVAPPEFGGTSPERTDLWLPFTSMALLNPHDSWVRTFLGDHTACCADIAGRLAPGISRERARGELGLLSADYRRQFGEDSHGALLTGTAPLQSLGRKARNIYAVFGLMFAGVLLVLLLACANVGNLLLARAAARRREIGVRLSLGAGRPRVVRQLLTESLVLAGFAAVCGVALAYVLPGPLFTRAVGEVAFSLQPDAMALTFTLALAVVACVAFGLAPALHATGGSLSDALKRRRAAAPGRLSLRSLLLTVQVAVSVVLLVGAGLLVRGIQHVRALDPGFAVQDVASIAFEFPTIAYQTTRIGGFYQDLTRGLDGVPGAHPFGLSTIEPLGNSNSYTGFRLPQEDEAHQKMILSNTVSRGYFEILRIPIVAGRNFEASDAERNVILVNQAMADRYFPGEAAVGKTILTNKPVEIVGVVRNAHTRALDDVEPALYTPVWFGTAPRLLIRNSAANMAAVASLAKGLDPRVETHVVKLSDNLDKWLSATRIGATIAGMLGILALSLAAIGIAGVFAYAVEQRTQEIGIRMALGAHPGQVIAVVFSSATRALAAGLILGMVAAVAGSRLLRQYIFGLSNMDPVTYGAVLVTLAVAGLAATYLPARRATAVDPMVALRQD